MYTIAIFRVCLLFVLIVLVLVLPEEVRDWIAHAPVIDNIINPEETQGLERYIYLCWIVLGAVVLISTLLWVCIILHMLLVRRAGGRPSPILGFRDDATLYEVNHLAHKIQVAAQNEPAECRRELLRLKQDEDPALQLTNFVGVFGPAWAMLLHIGIDLFNCYDFIFGSEDYFRAGLLALAIVITVCCMVTSTEHGLSSLYHECKESWERGMFTSDYLQFVRADKGIQSIPALVIVLSAVPFKEYQAGSLKSTVGAIGSIGINLALVVPFIMQEFDLGIEQEGYEEPEPIENEDAARSTSEMRDPLR